MSESKEKFKTKRTLAGTYEAEENVHSSQGYFPAENLP